MHPRTALAALCLSLATAALAQQPFQAPEPPRFEIQRFLIEGNTLIPPSEIDALLAPFAGPRRDFGDVQRALEALQDEYRNRGYTAVRVAVPEQQLASGQVRLQVTEARLRQVRVEDNRFFDAANVRAAIPSLRENEPPNTREVGRDLQLANENPARQASVSLEGTDEPGRIDAVVRIKDEDPKRVFLSLDNTGNSQTGQLRLGVGFQHANLGGADRVLTLQYITSPTHPRDVNVFGIGLRLPHPRSHGIFDVYAGYADVDSGTVQDLFTVSGRGTTFGGRYTHILSRMAGVEQRASVGWDYRAYGNRVALIGTTGSLIPDITVRPLTVGYTARLQRPADDIAAFASYSRNLQGGNDGDQAAFTAQRAGADASYALLRYGAAYTRRLPADLLLRASFNGQYTRDLLISGEQFGMGGADSVRGFFEREVSNDVGHRASFELYSPDFGARLGDGWQARALTFFDIAAGYDRAPARGADNGLSAAGIGVRLSRGRDFTLRLDWAGVLNAGGTRESGKDRLHFALLYTF